MQTEDKRLQSVNSVQQEDFNTVNPRAIWEAEKRLFFLPIVELDAKTEAANYLVRNRLDLSLPYIHEACSEHATEKYDGDDVLIPFTYTKQWYDPWVQDVRVFWNRIEYLIEEPTTAKHEAFRMACTSSDAFHKKTLYKYGFGKKIPVEDLEAKEDIPSANHLYSDDSMTGVVFLHDEESDLYSISISNTHSVYIKSKYDERRNLFLNEKPVGPDTSLKINFLNGYKVSSKVLEFITRQVKERADVLMFDLSGENPTVQDHNRRVYNSNSPAGKMEFVGLMKDAVYRFDLEERSLVLSRFEENQWIQDFLGS